MREMADKATVVVESRGKQKWGSYVAENQRMEKHIDIVVRQKGEINAAVCQGVSPKSRRKIRKPKHYKPTLDHAEHNGTSETVQVIHGSESSSPESVIPDQGTEVVPANAVHVMTASREKKKVEPKARARTARKQKNQAPPVPRKPEDLIKEAMIQGEPAPPASKRDAQYRKSYAYKIWKELGSQELQADKSNTSNGVSGGGKAKLPPGVLRNQARAAFYWQSDKFNGGHPPGFFANGKYYAITPQMMPAIHGGPQTSPSVPYGDKTAVSVTTSAHVIPNSVIQSSSAGVVSSVRQRVHIPTEVSNSGVENPKVVTKPRSPDVIVVPRHSPKENLSPSGPSYKSPGVITPPPIKSPTGTNVASTPVSQVDVAKLSPPRRASENSENVGTKNSETSEAKATSPSNLVSIMKTSLRQKHSKENVQPLPFKSKRKLEGTKNDGPPSKKNGKSTIFTPLNEQEAEKLANDIYDVNLEYFPFQTLAEKAAQSEEKLPETPERAEKPSRAKEIEKVRCLLKDFYDVTFSCTEDPDMQKFDSASRKFGRKNILNHLSLLDRYFAELQKKLDT